MSRMIVFALLALVSASCGKEQEPGDSKPAAPLSWPAASSPTASSDPRQDYTKPYLTDEKMVRYIKSLSAGTGMKDRQVRSLSDVKKAAEELNAFARKYGFKDFEDYMAVAGRIVAGVFQIMGDDMTKAAIPMAEENIKMAEEELKTPDLDPEMRKMYEEQIDSSKQLLEDQRKLKQPGQNQVGLNEADLALIKKYRPQLDKAAQEAEQAAAKKAERAAAQEAEQAADRE